MHQLTVSPEVPTTASAFLNTCSQYTKVLVGTLRKTQHRINEDVVLSLVSEMLKAIDEYAKHDRAEFVRVVQEAQPSQ
ncbi:MULTISPECIES: hypothetical protein [Bifidobacterium]|uniref:Recombinase n=1 Tax=Bifidobacterium apri TaxID=1769423 RepID=A0A6A2VG38_9BIFI|nr:hypothetical protein [Bifidobacterium apri]KAB8299739.1 recombinase [Bifidobacterium apri]